MPCPPMRAIWLCLRGQGLGDTALFARFLPVAQASGAEVLFAADAPVRRLLQGQVGPADVWCNLMDLARDLVVPFERLTVGVNWCGAVTYRGNAVHCAGGSADPDGLAV